MNATHKPTADAGGEAPAPAGDATVPAQQAGADTELASLRQEVAQLRDRNLRLMAEAQNQQKRAAREMQDAQRYAEAELARELLVVLDDLERTQASAGEGADATKIAEGVRIVYEHFHKILEQRQIRPIDAAGKPFDPAFHEALMQQPSDTVPAGHVLQELARGYTMHQRVLRPSRVVVSSGPAAAAEQSQKEAQA